VLGEAGTAPYYEFEPSLVAGAVPRAVALWEGVSSGGQGLKKLAGDGFYQFVLLACTPTQPSIQS